MFSWINNLFKRKRADAVDAEYRTDESAVDFCSRLVLAFEEKADHNKRESIANFAVVSIGTLITPIFITLGSGFWIGKVVPSVFSLVAAGATGWLQLRQPQRLWSLYRTAQRELEDQRTKYQFSLDECEDSDKKDKVLAKKNCGSGSLSSL